MLKKKAFGLLTAGILLAASPSMAQHWGQEATPRDGVCFYEHANFGGQYFCVAAGDSLTSMPAGMNDRISSFKIFGRAGVTVYKDNRFEGHSQDFDHDVRDLGRADLNDKISSLEVWSDRNHHHHGGDDRSSHKDERPGPHGISRATAEGIVRRAYLDVLDREPDPGAEGYVENVYRDGWSQRDVESELRKSPEYRNHRH